MKDKELIQKVAAHLEAKGSFKGEESIKAAKWLIQFYRTLYKVTINNYEKIEQLLSTTK